VRVFPPLVCSLGARAFVLPATGSAGDGLGGAGGGGYGGCRCGALPAADAGAELDRDGAGAAPPGLSLLAHHLGRMACTMGLKLDCFGLGPAARTLVRALLWQPANPRNNPSSMWCASA